MTTNVQTQPFSVKKNQNKTVFDRIRKNVENLCSKNGWILQWIAMYSYTGEEGSARKKSRLLWSTGRRPFITLSYQTPFSTAKLLTPLIGYKMMSGRNIL